MSDWQSQKEINIFHPLGDINFALLIKALDHNPFLVELFINQDLECVFENTQLETFYQALERNTNVQELFFSLGFINDCIPMAQVLKQNTTLQKLTLKHNSIGNHGAKMLADSLKQNTTLRSLHLLCNLIEDEGATALADALEQNKMLTDLSLSSNRVKDRGAQALGKSLKHNTILKILYLTENHIGDVGMHALAKGIQRNTSLKRLFLRKNVNFLAHSIKYIEKNYHIQLIACDENEKIDEICARNRKVFQPRINFQIFFL
jgi:hypothetical protein